MKKFKSVDSKGRSRKSVAKELREKIKEFGRLSHEEFRLHQERLGMISAMQDDEFDRHYGRMTYISRELRRLNDELQEVEGR